MKKIITILLYLLIPFLSFSQEKGAFGIEINSNYNLIKTKEFNLGIDEAIIDWPENRTLLKRREIKNGFDLGVNLSFQTTTLFNIGVFTKYSMSKSINDFRTTIVENPILGTPADTLYNSINYSTVHSIIGIYSDFAVSNLEAWPKENGLRNMELKISLGVGYSYSRFISLYEKKLINGFLGEVNPVSGIHLMGNIKLGYKLVQNPIFSSIGLQLGYQALMTSSLKGGELITFKENEAPQLNFHGLTLGVYLTLGK